MRRDAPGPPSTGTSTPYTPEGRGVYFAEFDELGVINKFGQFGNFQIQKGKP